VITFLIPYAFLKSFQLSGSRNDKRDCPEAAGGCNGCQAHLQLLMLRINTLNLNVIFYAVCITKELIRKLTIILLRIYCTLT
jgi:hypothetical protein